MAIGGAYSCPYCGTKSNNAGIGRDTYRQMIPYTIPHSVDPITTRRRNRAKMFRNKNRLANQ
jgi:hypothetical protein